MMPVWFLNMCAVTDWQDPQRIYDMAYFSPFILRWLDQTKVKGNPDQECIARVIGRLWRRFGDFSKVQPPFGGLKDVIQVDRRIRGLV